MANAMRATYPAFDPAAAGAYDPNKSAYYNKRSAAKGKPTIVTDANGNKKLVYVPWGPGEGPAAGANEQFAFQPTYQPPTQPLGPPLTATPEQIGHDMADRAMGSLTRADQIAGGAPLTLQEGATMSHNLAESQRDAYAARQQLKAKEEAAARAKYQNVPTPRNAEEAIKINHKLNPELGPYQPTNVELRKETPLESYYYTGPGGAYAGGGRRGPMPGTYGTAGLPTLEERESAEWNRKLDETRARAAEIRQRMAQTPRNMTRYDKDKNPTGRVVTTGKFREDGTEMLKDRVTGLPYYQSPGATPATTPVAEMRLPAPEVGSVGWSMDMGKKWSAQPETAPQYQAPVDAAAAAQARFNKYMAGADDRQLRKFETGSVKGTLTSEATDQVAQRQAQFAGKQFDDTGKQLYSQLMGRLQGIQRAKLRPGQKSRALKQWMDEFDAAGLDQHVVTKPTPQELFDQSVVGPHGERYSTIERNGGSQLTKVADAPKPVPGAEPEKPAEVQIGDVPFAQLPGKLRDDLIAQTRTNMRAEAENRGRWSASGSVTYPTEAAVVRQAEEDYAVRHPQAAKPPIAPATTVQGTPTEEPGDTSTPPDQAALMQAYDDLNASLAEGPGWLGANMGPRAERIDAAKTKMRAEMQRMGITPERADYLYSVHAARRFLAKAESLSPEARQDPVYLEQRKKALELVNNAS